MCIRLCLCWTLVELQLFCVFASSVSSAYVGKGSAVMAVYAGYSVPYKKYLQENSKKTFFPQSSAATGTDVIM